MATPKNCKPAKASNSSTTLSSKDSRKSARKCHASAKSRRTSSLLEYSRSFCGCCLASDIVSLQTCRWVSKKARVTETEKENRYSNSKLETKFEVLDARKCIFAKNLNLFSTFATTSPQWARFKFDLRTIMAVPAHG